jgi:hypothetical protein
VIVNSPTTAEVDITIAANASLGARGLAMTTGGEIATLAGAFTVLPYTPTLSVSPSSGMIATTVNVNFNGNFTHFAQGQTTANIDGNGVTIQNFTVNSPHNATAQFVIAQSAPAAPSVLCMNQYGGNRIITLETPLASGSEIVQAGFCVTSTPAVLTSISPYHSAAPAANLNVTITGQYTHFQQGTTTVGFGPNITVNSVSVSDATDLVANIGVDATAVIGWRPVFVNTGSEQLTIGFAIDPPATSSLVSVLPNSGYQGESKTVQITGNLTNFNNTTTAILGAGITVNSLTINSAASATAQISIDPTTPAGGRTVSMVTQLASGNEEVVSGPLFSVTQGIASIAAVGTSSLRVPHQFQVHQGDILDFRVEGASTHWLQGETTLDFGPGITVSQITVTDATHISCQVAVSYSAALGLRGVNATTGGEVAPSFSDAIDVLPSEATSMNITPTSAQQGTTFTVQVNGIATHFTPNNTIASFGNNNGVNVTAVNVISATQMNLSVQVLGTAYVGPYTLTVTTTGLPVPPNPQSTEQLTLTNVLSISPGAAIITNVQPTGGAQGSTASITVTGQNTNFQTGVTTAYFSASGCNPPTSAGINVTNVTASSHASATLAVAISPTAPTGYQTLCMYTQGESVSYGNAFQVTPGTPTLNQVSPVSGQQGQTLQNVQILGQFTHFQQGVTTVTFGQGITVSNLQITGPTSATATLAIDSLAATGMRTATATTGAEVVSGNFFSVTAGAAILSSINPSTANQGQHILMTITGQNTHWSQQLTQFSITGGGYDITVNGVVVNGATSAVADLTISGTASLGTRTIVMSTGGETVALQAGFVVTGGVPSISSISPNYGTRGDQNDNILITGAFTHWTSSTVIDFGDPAITVTNATTVNSSTSITAVINIGAGATLGVHTVTVRTGNSVQLGQFTINNPAAPPTPYVSYEYPSVALVGQTMSVSLNGAYTNWLPGQTTATFGAGIQVNSFQVTGINSAVANITINPGATPGQRTVTITTGAQQLNTSFYVTVGTPAISLVDPSTVIQGETRLIDLVGQYTTWTDNGPNPTQFSFCNGVTVTPGSLQIFGPTAARVQVTVDPLANTGGCSVAATTGSEVAHQAGSASFSITPATAIVSSVTPNTAIQGATNFTVNVVGFGTLWNNTTAFNFGSGVSVTQANVVDNTHATLTLSLDPYASPGNRTLSATTGGQVAYLNNAFVVQPGTPILLSSTPGSAQQQANFSIGILGQYTSFNAQTTVAFPNGGVSNLNVNVTGPQSITVTGVVSPTAYPGCGGIIVTTPGQTPSVLTLHGAFCITQGPAAIMQLSPNQLGQGQTANIAITGTNSNFTQGVTVANFGPGISVNTLAINSPTSATANITVAANATPQQNTVTLTTAGETATDPAAFTIFAATPVLDIVYPGSGSQGQSNIDVCITSSFTHFVNGNTTADFGAGITVTSTTVAPTGSCPQGDATHATANITIQPTAAPGARTVRMITSLGGGSQEIAIKSNSFTVNTGSATINAATPSVPATVHQNDTGDIIIITGSQTHFTAATPTISFCSGVTVVGQTVNSDTQITATVNVSTYGPIGACGVTVTTGGEVASGSNLFTVLAGIPVITVVSPNSANQNDGQGMPLSVNITGLYTHFTSGGLSVSFGSGITLSGSPVVNSDISLTVKIQVDPTAAVGTRTLTVTDAADGVVSIASAFSIGAGVPSLVSVSPNTGAQGSTQTITITGNYTSWTAATTVSVSGGSDVTVGGGATVTNLPNGYQQTIQVPFTVTQGAAATARTVTVTTGAQALSLASAFTVLPGVPNVTQIHPNIGVPNSTVNVTITGQFTNWVNGTTTANFGSGISVNGAALGADGVLNVSNATTATATLTIDAAAALGARNVTVTTGAQVLTVNNGFTVQANTTTPPTVLYISPANNSSGAPTNTRITVAFSEPMNPATITAANAFISDGTTQGSCWTASGLPSADPTLDASGRVLTIIPSSALPVGRTFYLQLNSYDTPGGTPTIADQSGNALGHNCYSFTTGFAPANSGPSFISANVANGATGVPTNSKIILGFTTPINPATVSAGLSIQQGATSVPGTWGYSSDFTQAIFTPASNLTPSVTYTVTYSASITDEVGTALANPGTLTFTTGAASDISGLSMVTYTPPNGATAATNPQIRVVFNKPVNPLTVTPASFYLFNYQNNATVQGATGTASPDNRTFTLNLAGSLLPSTQYRWYIGTVYDWTGLNSYSSYGPIFTTGTGPDNTAPSVVSVSPAAGAAGVPVNPLVYVHFSEPLDPTSLANSNVSLSPAVSGTVSFVNGDYSTVTFQPSAILSPSTAYTINVTGFRDQSGNAMAVFAGSSFTTSGSAIPDTMHGTITATPTSNATNVPVNTNVVLQLSKAVDPLTVNSKSFRVYDNTAGVDVPGSITISANYLTLTFASSSQFQPGHQICVHASYDASLYDLAGNDFSSLSQCFSTGSGADTIAPAVISVSPLNAATGIGPSNPVIVTFSKSINPGTLANNVALYNGSTLYTSSYTPSSDYTTIVFNTGYLPFSTTFTVVVSPNIADLAGNHLAAEFTSAFTTGPQPATAQPQVTAMRPGNGASGVSSTTPITFFMSAPMNPATINSGSVKISQNGTLLAGTITLSADNQDVVFTPNGGNFQSGALIQVWFTNAATDGYGNPLYNYQSSFTIQPDLTGAAPMPISYYPCQYCSGYDRTTIIEIRLNKPFDPATVNSANFYVTDSGNNPVAGTITLLDNNRLLRFKPTNLLAANTYFYVHPTTNLKDIDNLSYAGATNYYFYTGAASNAAAPSVIATAPTNGAIAIGTNAAIGVTFGANIDSNTLDASTVTLTGPGGDIPLSISYNASTFSMTVTPQAPLPPNATVTLTLNGVTDGDGSALSSTPYNLSFTTAAAPDYSAPILTLTNVTSGQTGVPVTSSLSLTFNKPIDMRTVVYGNSIYLRDNTANSSIVPATVSPVGSSGLLITPNSLLSVNHQYQMLGCGIADLTGNSAGCYFVDFTFTTVLNTPAGGPAVTAMIPVNGSANVPVNFKPMAQFDRPVNPAALSGVILMQGGNPVPATPALSAGGTILTLTPVSILAPNASYVFTVSGLLDSAGIPMSGSVTRSFTTGPAIDLTAPQMTSITPIVNSTAGTNPLLRLTFNKPLNPISSGSFNFYNYLTNRGVSGTALNWAADFQSVQFTYPGPLDPNSRYAWYISTITDLAGNTNNTGTEYFYTGAGADSGPETVLSVTPPSGSTGVPLNAVLALRLSKPASPGSINNSSVILSPPVSGLAVQLSGDGLTITLAHANSLAANTAYQITVPPGGFTDQDGNPVSAFNSGFTTATSADTISGTISLTNPAPATSGVPLTQAITATFSKPLNPNSLAAQSFVVCKNAPVNGCNYQIAGTVTNPTANTLVFTPSVALPSNTRIDIYVGYYASIQDLAANNFNSLNDAYFTTASTADNTPPQVTFITPAAGATNVGPYAPVAISFNKSLDYNTINPYNFALYNGSANLGATVSYSSDRSVVYLNYSPLPYSATLTVVVSTNVKDYNGNNLPNPYTSTFTTEAQPFTYNPSVTQVRPTGSGAALNSPITLYMNSPMDLSTVQSGMYVAQNGALIAGSISLTADHQGIVWMPASDYQPGALIEVYLYPPAADINGNPVGSYSYSFHTLAAPGNGTAPVATAFSPCRNCNIGLQKPVIEVQFSKPLNPATVTNSTFYVNDTSNHAVSGTVTLLNNNTVIRFTPSAPLNVSQYYYPNVSSGVQDTSGNAFAGDNWYFYITGAAVNDNTPLAVQSITPVNGASGIGDNAPVRLVFSKVVDTLTMNPGAVSLMNGANSLPYTVTFTTINSSSQTVAVLTPQSPLPDSSTISVVLSNGITDLSGNPLTPQTTTFTTMAGADFSSAFVTSQSVDNHNNSNVPANSTFTLVFNKPLDPASVTSGGFYLYDLTAGTTVPAALNVSADGRSVTISPSSNLAGAHNMRYYWGSAADLTGNAISGGAQGFTTSSAPDTTPPAVVSVNPSNNNTNAPTNAWIELMFSEAVRGTSLGDITLTAGGSVPFTAALNNSIYTDDTVVRLIPQQLLLPNTTYTVTVSGVQDVAGNAMASPYAFQFTTGSNFQAQGLLLPAATVTTIGGTNTLPTSGTLPNVLDNPTFTFVFDHAVDYASLVHGGFTLRDTGNNIVNNVTLNFALSADQKTVTITTSGLAAGTTYHLWLEYGGGVWLYDIAGNQTSGFSSQQYAFTTQ